MRDLDKEILALQKQIDALEVEKKVLCELTPEKLLAVNLHDTLCHFNHVDGCGWDYEFKGKAHDWKGHVHARYLEKSHKLLRRCIDLDITPTAAISLVKEIEKY
jgi:hypothetical protein